MSNEPTQDLLHQAVAHTLRKLQLCRYFYLAPSPGHGVGVFAARNFPAGSEIMQDREGDFFERLITLDELKRSAIFDYALQVGEDAYRVPSGGIEDFTNHSCTPNTGLRQVDDGIVVIALSDIAPHDEITFDYSTWQTATALEFKCCCGAPNCRGTIAGFSSLPPRLQKYYIERDVVGRFVLERGRDRRAG